MHVTGPSRHVGFSYGDIVATYLAHILGLRVRRVILSGPGEFGTRSMPPDRTDLRGTRDGMTELEIDEVYRHNFCLLMFSDPLKVDDLAVWNRRDNIARARVRSGTIPDTSAPLDVLAESSVRLARLWDGQRTVLPTRTIALCRRPRYVESNPILTFPSCRTRVNGWLTRHQRSPISTWKTCHAHATCA